MPPLFIGTSAFTAAGWESTFYPEGLPEREYLTCYATKFDTVEVDSTFYRARSLQTVKGWNAKTPPGFISQLRIFSFTWSRSPPILCNFGDGIG
jgi:uncharacterized protein YecE (DUF72 family)